MYQWDLQLLETVGHLIVAKTETYATWQFTHHLSDAAWQFLQNTGHVITAYDTSAGTGVENCHAGRNLFAIYTAVIACCKLTDVDCRKLVERPIVPVSVFVAGLVGSMAIPFLRIGIMLIVIPVIPLILKPQLILWQPAGPKFLGKDTGLDTDATGLDGCTIFGREKA
jgi:hypothetical protein